MAEKSLRASWRHRSRCRCRRARRVRRQDWSFVGRDRRRYRWGDRRRVVYGRRRARSGRRVILTCCTTPSRKRMRSQVARDLLGNQAAARRLAAAGSSAERSMRFLFTTPELVARRHCRERVGGLWGPADRALVERRIGGGQRSGGRFEKTVRGVAPVGNWVRSDAAIGSWVRRSTVGCCEDAGLDRAVFFLAPGAVAGWLPRYITGPNRSAIGALTVHALGIPAIAGWAIVPGARVTSCADAARCRPPIPTRS